MKKIFITTVFAVGSLTAFAQEAEAVEAPDSATEVQQEAADAAVGGQEVVNEPLKVKKKLLMPPLRMTGIFSSFLIALIAQ